MTTEIVLFFHSNAEIIFYSNVRDYLKTLDNHETAIERVLQVVFGTNQRTKIVSYCELLINGIQDPEEEYISEVLKSDLPQVLRCALG